MKKLLLVFLLLLSACSFKEDYFQLSIDDYTITTGYDNGQYLDVSYDYDVKNELDANETVKNINLYLFDDLLGEIELTNYKNKSISYQDAIITKLTVYLNDLKGREFRINNNALDKSIKKNCETFNGTYIEKNGYACVIQNKVGKELNVVELYGDYLNIDQDELDHIVIYVE